MARPANPDFTKKELTRVALQVAERVGFASFRMADVAEAAGCGYGTVTLRFGTVTKLRTSIMRAAVKERCLAVIATGIAMKHPAALGAPKPLKDAALATLA
jgi:AcrR family transcriptional regulator